MMERLVIPLSFSTSWKRKFKVGCMDELKVLCDIANVEPQTAECKLLVLLLLYCFGNGCCIIVDTGMTCTCSVIGNYWQRVV